METVLSIFICVGLGFTLLGAFPMLPEDDDKYEMLKINDSNGTEHDLYIIRTIVYEVGILTDADNDTNIDQSFEEINFKFFDPEHNETTFDLSNIPPPIETNFTSETVTGITDGTFGSIVPNYFVKEIANISTTDPKEEREILKHLPIDFEVL